MSEPYNIVARRAGATLERGAGEPAEGSEGGAAALDREPAAAGVVTDRGGLPLAPGQEGLWFLSRLAPESGAYHIAAAARVGPAVDLDALGRAAEALSDRHPLLRATFHPGAAGPSMRPGAAAGPVFARVAAAGWSAERLDEAVAEAAHRPFALAMEPPMRVLLFAGAPVHGASGSGAVLLFVLHHLVADFATLALLARELGVLYAAERHGLAPPPPAALAFPVVAVEQRRRLAGAEGERLRSFWRRELAGDLPDLDLPPDRPRPRRLGPAGSAVTVRLGSRRVPALRAAARRHGTTPFTVLLAAFATLLGRWSGQARFQLGTPASLRTSRRLAEVVGYLVNPLVVRVDLGGEPSFGGLVARLGARVRDALAHRELPFGRLVEELGVRRDEDRPPLFQAMLVWQRAPRRADDGFAAFAVDQEGVAMHLGELALTTAAVPRRASQLDLTLTAAEVGEEVVARVEVAAELFDPTTARRLAAHLGVLLEAAVADPDRPLADLPLLTGGEAAQLAEWGAAPLLEPAPPLPELFSRRAAAMPETAALVWGEEHLSYGELAARAAALAAVLAAAGVGPEEVVGVLADRTPALAVALLGVLAAGGAYLPLDPAYPAERLEFMLDDAGARRVVTVGRAAASLGGREANGRQRLELDPAGFPREAADGPPPAFSPPAPLAGALAYVLYTSGSTGRPKGVAIAHRGAAALVAWARREFSAGELAGVLAATSVCFDLSVFELFVTWGAGGTVLLADNALALPRLPAASRVTLVNTVPSAMAALVRGAGVPAGVRAVNLAGEPLPAGLVSALYARPGVERVRNLYGPSEDTTYSTWARIPRGDGLPAIGRPVAGTRASVLDRRLAPLPVAVPGELFLGGEGLARGYVRRPGLTAERFVPDPRGGAGERLYRTGDRVRWRRDGELEFLGRFDHQVKVRGFRIEPGEVEALLAAHPALAEAVVVARPAAAGEAAGELRLVAYVVPRPGAARGAAQGATLRADLAGRLPAYMVPATWVELPALPRLPNGKVDRARLPEPAPAAGEGAAPAGPWPAGGPLVEILAGFWEELLGTPPAGPAADFFALGGHSLLAARLAARVEEALGVELPLAEVLAAPTLAGLAARLEAARSGAVPPPPITPRAGAGAPPLSFAQERLWFLDRLTPGSPLYHLPGTLVLDGPLDLAALERALGAIARRHQPLGAAFPDDEGRPVQTLAVAARLPLALVDLAALPAAATGELAARLGEAEARRPFDLSRGPLARLVLLRLGRHTSRAPTRDEAGERCRPAPRRHLALITFHHIAADGWSLGEIFPRELSRLYAAFAAGEPDPLPPLPVTYGDFARWQREWLAGARRAAEIAFWRRYLAGAPEEAGLPADRPRRGRLPGRAGRRSFALGPATVVEVGALARRAGATPFMVLLAAFYATLARFSGEGDLPVGTPVAGRRRVETEGLIGLFVNTLVLRGRMVGDPPFSVFVEEVRESCLAAFAHPDLPFEVLVEALAPARRPGTTPLFQVMLALANLPAAPLALPGLRVERRPPRGGAAKFDLSLDLEPAGEGGGAIAGWALYDADRYDAATVARFLGAYRRLLEAGLATPQRPLSALSGLAPAEAHQLLREGVPAAAEAPWRGGVGPAIAARAAERPEAVALTAAGEHLSFRELARRAGALGRRLAALGVAAEERVAISCEPSPEAVVALLGVLAAGGAWVAIDPSEPSGRRAEILADSRPRALVVTSRHEVGADGDGPPAVAVAEVAGEGRGPGGSRWAAPAPGQLAYLLYTSGSTGRPKGVMVPHRALEAYVGWAAATLIAPLAALPFTTRLAFDAFLKQVLSPLLLGRALWVPAAAVRDRPAALAVALGRRPGAGFNSVPALWEGVLAAIEAGEAPAPALSRLLLGGERLPAGLVARTQAVLPGVEVVNLYGPTEATANASWERLGAAAPRAARGPKPSDEPAGGAGEPRPGPRHAGEPTLGRPLAAVRLVVVDRRLGPLPAGVVGELAIGGPGLARGYRGRPAGTAAAFVPDPFSTGGERLYLTGDLGRRLPDGRFAYHGRRDHQVKLRGVRIELGEVESALVAHPAVAEAVAVLAADAAGAPRLAAYLVLAPSAPEDWREAVARHLAERLPPVMRPAAYEALASLPRTAGGKVDRGRLAARPVASLGPAADSPPPRTPAEEAVAEVWREVLEAERVGAHDDFFALGGHSLAALRVVARLGRVFAVELPVAVLFQAPTVAALARRVEAAGKGGVPAPILPAERTGPLPLSFQQQRLWFLEQIAPGQAAYHIAVAVELRGDLAVPALAGALGRIVARHEALRTTFPATAGRPAQAIRPPSSLALPVVDLSRLGDGPAAGLAARAARRPFDLASGPLLRPLLMRLARNHRLLLTVHHLVADGWSLGVLVRELAALYAAAREGRPAALPALALQYADYAAWQRSALTPEALAPALEHWRVRLAGLPVLELPGDRPRPAARSGRGGRLPLVLPPPLVAGLAGVARRRGTTLFVTLLGAFAALLARHARTTDLGIGVPVANRRQPEVEGLIGFFVNTLVLRCDLAGDPSFGDLLGRLRETTLAAWAHQEVPFERLVEELAPRRDLATSPLFQAMLVLQNTPQPPLELAGLELAAIEVATGTAKFDLTLTLRPVGEALAGSLEFDVDLFDAATVRRLGHRLAHLLAAVVEGSGAPLSALPMVGAAERQQLVAEWNDTAAPAPEETLPALLAVQGARTPEAVAVVAEDQAWSFSALRRWSGALAARLAARGVGPEVRVGLAAERSVGMVAGLCALLEAGGAWVPLDPASPAERLAWMIDDALGDGGAPLLVERRGLLPPETLGGREVIDLSVTPDGVSGFTPPALHPESLAYLIYTSGSTGRPKGVANRHRGIVNRLRWGQRFFGFAHDDRVLHKTPLSFDVSVWELLSPLTSGARLVLARPGGHRDPLYLARVLAERAITSVHFVASMLQVFVTEVVAAGEDVELGALRRIVASGEALSHELEQRALEVLGAPLFNLYGPTEAAVEVTWWACGRAASPRPVPIGRPVDGARVTVVEPSLAAAPIGVPGELVIGGVPLARGYHRRPALTAERFIPDPFPGGSGERLYRSGDLARLLPGGEVEFLGRLDHQVKIRGQRVELGEVEAVLATAPGVAEAAAAVLAAGTPEVRLVGYLVGHASPPAPAAVEAYARGRLPPYMVPGQLLTLQTLPRTSSGKVDRKALPAPPAPAAAAAGGPPRTPLEELVAETFAALLVGALRPGRGDDFFALGGHSLVAVQVIARLRRAAGVEIPLSALFEAPTVAGLAERLETLRRGAATPAVDAEIPPAPRDRPLPLSYAQQRLWFLHQMAPHDPSYNIPAAVRLDGPLSVGRLATALSALSARHEALRTRFPTSGGRPLQEVAPPAPVPLPLVDLGALAAGDRDARLAGLLEEVAARPFDLEAGPLWRARLVGLGAERHALAVTLHHVIADGWSLAVFFRELTALYAEERSPLPALPVQYADFATWQRRRLGGEALAARIEHWRRRLAGAPPVLELPADRPRPPVRSARGDQLRFRLDGALVAALGATAQAEGVTLFMALLAAFAALLGRLSGRRDLVIGVPVAARDRLELEGLIGFFANTLALRCDLGGDPPFALLLARTRETVLDAHGHQDLPFERLVEELAPERNPAYTPLVQVVLALQNAPPVELALPRIGARHLPLAARSAKFDLTLALYPPSAALTGGEEGAAGSPGPAGSARHVGLAGILEFATDLFDRTTMERLLRQLRALLAAAAADPATPLSRLPLLAAGERHQLLHEWNDSATAYPRRATVDGLFTDRAAALPDAVAVVTEGGPPEHLTYAALDAASGRLAGRLAALGVGPEARVGVAMDRSPALVTALCAILRAGAAYVPLDLSYPPERLALMAEDAGLAAVVVGERRPPEGPFAGLPEVVSAAAGEGTAPPPAAGGPDRLAYVTYTSGSTGRPKGVEVPHRGVVRLVCDTGYARFGADRVLLTVAPVAFDASTLEVWGALLHGARLVVLPPGVPSLERLGRAFTRHRVTTAFLTARLFDLMVEERPGDLEPLEDLLVGGEAVSPAHAARALGGPGPSRLLNGYGPTENTTFTCCYRLPAGFAGASVPIGRPIGNTGVHVLDRELVPVPVGVPGELATGGAGLARGYHARPALTAERFVPDPTGATGGRLYRTGDLVRRLPDGNVDFLGRLDDQVKLRGFRVEPGEVEAVLAGHPQVRAVAVVVRSDERGERRLVAYAVGAPGEREPGGPDAGFAERLAAFAAARLPEYMLPTAWVLLETLPLTAHGKVDRRALPAPAAAPGVARAGLQGDRARLPRTPAEELLAGLWSELLAVEQVAVDDDFFALGGHSLLATQLVSRIRETFAVELPLATFFAAPTLGAVAWAIAAERGAAALPALLPQPRGAAAPLSFAQERLWFLDQLQPGSPAYNVPLALAARGPLSHRALAGAFAALVRRHEVLRSRFVEGDHGPLQEVAPAAAMLDPRGRWPLPVIDLAGLGAAERAAAARRLAAATAVRPFDLGRAPLLRTALCRLDEGEHLLLVDLHHIVTDGWSMGVLLDEVATLYGAAGSARLAPLPVQYADFALAQRRWHEEGRYAEQLAYWRRQLAGVDEPLEVPADRPRPAVQTLAGTARSFVVDRRLAASLAALAHRRRVTPFMLYAAAFYALLYRYTGRTDLTFGTPIAGRNRRQIEGLIGFFVNTLVLRVDLAGVAGFAELASRVRVVALDAYAHQDLPFERLVEELAPQRRLSHQPLFQVMFALQNAPLGRLALPGVELELVEVARRTAKADLSMTLEPRGGELWGELSFSTDLFDATTAQRLLGHWHALLAGIAADPGAALDALPLLAAGQRHQLLAEWNDHHRAVPEGVFLPALLAAVTAARPDTVAVVSAGVSESLSYAELDARAERLARRLRRLGVGPEARVGICMLRSPAMVVAQLAVLKAGGAYVPLDIGYPAERLAFMAADARLVACLADRWAGDEPPWPPGLPVLDPLAAMAAGAAPAASAGAPGPGAEIDGSSLAYVIYTSGSTGRPKGVAVSHRALMRLMWSPPPVHEGGERVAIWAAAVSFDVSVSEVWGTLVGGGRLVVLATPTIEVDAVSDAVLRHAVRVATFTTGLFQLMVDECIDAFAWMRQVATGGDVASPLHFRKLLRRWPHLELMNDYGPTENTVYSSYFAARRPADVAAQLSIGRPLRNSTAYVLDRGLRPLPHGVPGELCLGGDGLARGYLGHPGRTAGVFVPHPLTDRAGERLYRSGDLARHRADGNLDFLGRLDHQVKVRGFRIELGEIETVLGRHPAVAAAVVVAREDVPGEKRLVGYVVREEGAALSAEDLPAELTASLARRLPDYMVPPVLMVIDALPLSANQKVDRAALPAPRPSAAAAGAAPESDLERAVAGVWQEVLGLAEVGVHDNFFEVGGSSLTAARVRSRLERVLGRAVPLVEIFKHPTVAALAESLADGHLGGAPRPEAVPRPLAAARERSAGRRQAVARLRRRRSPGQDRADSPAEKEEGPGHGA